MNKYNYKIIWYKTKYYLVNSNDLNYLLQNFRDINGLDDYKLKKDVRVSNFNILWDSNKKQNQTLIKKDLFWKTIFIIKNLENFIKLNKNLFQIRYIKIEYKYERIIWKIIKSYLKNYKKSIWGNKKKKFNNKYILKSIKELWNIYFNEDLFSWIINFNLWNNKKQKIIFINKKYEDVINILDWDDHHKNKIWKKLVCENRYLICEILGFNNFKDNEQINSVYDQKFQIQSKFNILEDIVQSSQTILNKNNKIIYLYYLLEYIIFKQVDKLKNKDEKYNNKNFKEFLIKQFKKDFKRTYNYYFYMKENKEHINTIEQIINKKQNLKYDDIIKIYKEIDFHIRINKNKNKYNLIKNWFISNYIYFIITNKKSEWLKETKNLINSNYWLLERIEVNNIIKNMYIISDDIIKQTFNIIQENYQNWEIIKKEYKKELIYISENLIEEKNLIYIYDKFKWNNNFIKLIKKFS